MSRRHTYTRVVDPDLAAIADVRRALSLVRGWEGQVRVLFYVLKEVWPNAWRHLMGSEAFREKG